MTPSATRTTLVDLGAPLACVAGVLAKNEPVHDGCWRHQNVAKHMRHAAAHLDAYAQLASVGERPAMQDAEEELAHAAARRVLMAHELLLRQPVAAG